MSGIASVIADLRKSDKPIIQQLVYTSRFAKVRQELALAYVDIILTVSNEILTRKDTGKSKINQV